MKNGVFLLTTVLFSSALYAQQPLTYPATEELFSRYNPQLMARAAQEDGLRSIVQQVITTYISQHPLDTLENRYTLIALARNFENSLALRALTEQYQEAALYAQLGNAEVLEPAREAAQKHLVAAYARMWAVSVQVKESLLEQYKQLRRETTQNTHLTQPEQKARKARLDNTIRALQADINQLRTAPEQKLLALTQETLTQADEQVRAKLTSLEAESADNLQIKTKHKKPVAE